MQQSLAVHMSDLDKLSATLDEKSKMLNESYQKVKDTDQIKTAFLHNMTNNMIAPAATVRKDVQALCDSKQKMTEEELDHLVDEIQQQGTDITKLLNDLLAMAESNAAEGLNEK
jgi:methyl-accepting chemotaxis protein